MMQCVRGKQWYEMQRNEVLDWASRYRSVAIDLGTGDGRYARHLARNERETAVVGIDLCAANLRQVSRGAPANALFVVADALALPGELSAIADQVTIHFPWGSLLRGLLHGDTGLMAGLQATGKKGTLIQVAINAGALAEAGCAFEQGRSQVVSTLRDAGLRLDAVTSLDARELRSWPTSWAKRLAFGRDPRAFTITASSANVIHPRYPIPQNPSPRVLQLAAGRHDAGLM